MSRCCLFCCNSQIITEVETFGKELTDTALSFGNIAINNKFAVYPQVIERVELFRIERKIKSVHDTILCFQFCNFLMAHTFML